PAGVGRSLRAVGGGGRGRGIEPGRGPGGATGMSEAKDRCLRVLEGMGVVLSVAWSPDRSALASGSCDRTVRIWDATTDTLRAALTGHEAPVTSVAWSPDGSTLASGSADRAVRVWDATTDTLRAALTGHADIVW